MLIKSELETIPVLPVPDCRAPAYRGFLTAVDLIDLPRSGTVLVADCFDYKTEKLACRFFSDGKTYWTSYKWPDPKWSKFNPAISSWYGVNSSVNKAEDTKLAERFFHKKEKESWRTAGALAVIDAFVEEYQKERRNKARARRQALQDRHFAMYPAFPNNLEEYCEDLVFDHTYLFFEKLDKKGQRYAKCGHCRERFPVPKTVKQNEDTQCPRCGRKAVYKAIWRVKNLEDKARICIAAKVSDQLLLRWANIYRSFFGEKCTKKITAEDYAYNLYITDKNGKKKIYAYSLEQNSYCWKRRPNGTQNVGETYLYTDNLEEVFGKKYYNVDLQAGLSGRRIQISFNSLLNHLKKYPAAEYLFKLGMPVLAAQAGDLYMSTDKGGFSEVLGVSKQYLPMYAGMNVNVHEHWLIKEYGKWVSPEDLAAFRMLGIRTYDYSDVRDFLKTMSLGKFIRYFTKQKATAKRTTSFLMTQYKDYISMAKTLKLDLSRKNVRWPENICHAHDEAVEAFNKIKFDKEDGIFAEAVKTLYAALPATEYESEEYCIVLPRFRRDLIREGKSLSHCVGNDEYYKKHIAGKTMIVFIRKISDREKPFVTMEVNMKDYRIIQIYGFGDRTPKPEVRAFAKGYVNLLKSGAAKEKERKTA